MLARTTVSRVNSIQNVDTQNKMLAYEGRCPSVSLNDFTEILGIFFF